MAYPISKKLITVLVAVFLLVSSNFFPFAIGKTNALSGNEFNAGRIIDDFVFFNPTTMSGGQIQSFLNAKVPVCDTNGTQPYAGTTRAAYGTSKGYPPPYICLKDYSMTTVSKPAEPGLCGGYNIATQSAAQIIYGVAQSCGINPKVLLVLLQKEQTLVTDDWPWSIQYRSATGYGCPDTAPCDTQYYGFFNQVYAAARQFKNYAKNSVNFTYRPNRNNYVLYNPSSSCGGSNVYIENQATAGLYNYTPYQPNAAALSNLYGTGDGCSAYGNRNFWRLFSDWFGSTQANCNLLDMNGRVYRLYNPSLNDYLYTTNNIEVCMATEFYGYVADDFVFTVTPPTSGGIPVYRLSSPLKQHFYTTNLTEKNNLVNTLGYLYEGVAYTAKASPDTGYLPVYRLAPKVSGSHYYTPSTGEKNLLSAGQFTNEGIIFYTPVQSQPNVPVYRLRAPNGSHFFTSSGDEKNNAVSALKYVYEGVSFTGQSVYNAETKPVYRLMAWPFHIFTPSIGERKNLLLTGYKNEGIAFYMPTAGTKPVYRLYRHADGDHLFTMSAYERDKATSSYGYVYEGISFYSY